ncbi:hypothetical protein V1279_006395 [Bradyrhizobium sp. AZCC 1610]
MTGGHVSKVPACDIGIGRSHQLRGALFVSIPSSEQKPAPRFGALLLDIGQIDGVSFHQKLDGHRNDQERRNVDRESRAFIAAPPRFQLGRYHILGCSGFSTALMPSSEGSIADVIKRTPKEAVYRRATVIATARTISQESAPIHPAESASHSNAPLGKRLKPNQLKPTSSEERTSTLTF